MPINARRLRKILARVLPEGIKRRLRARLFGYRATTAGAGWSMGSQDGRVKLRANGIEAVFPEWAESSLKYHCFENGDSIEELQGFLNHAKSGPGMLYDVGAADGLFSTLYCLADRGSRAVAFEPSADMFPHVQSVVSLNKVGDRVTAVNAAVGQSTGTVAGDLNSAGMLIVSANTPSVTQVPMVCLDDRVAEYGVPTAIKIDVEGYEGEVLHGARQLLAKYRPVLFLEFHLDVLDQKGVRTADLLALLVELGYGFETSLGSSLTAGQIAGSPKSILRFVAREVQTGPDATSFPV